MEVKLKVLAVGEVLWDVVKDRYLLGGAPFNVCAHLAKMHHHSYIFTAIGRDSLGDQILERMKQIGVNQTFVGIHETKPTGTVDVFLEDGQPDYTIHEDVAWDELLFTGEQLSELDKIPWDVVIFGLLCQRDNKNAHRIYQIIEATNTPHVFLDVNIRKEFYTREKLERSFQLATLVKLNEDELELMRDLLYPKEGELRFAAEKLVSRFQLSVIIITLGAKGAWAYSKKKWYKAVAQPIDLADAIGAGDSFSAAFLHAYLQGMGVHKALDMAVEMGAFVASQSGAIPEYDQAVKTKLNI